MPENREPGAIDSLDEWAVTGGKVEALARRDEEPRHGERLREVLQEDLTWGTEEATGRLLDIAHEIDKDVGIARLLIEMSEEIARGRADVAQATREDLRQKVEEAVGRLRYAVRQPYRGPCGGGEQPLDVLDAEALQAELDRIFGDRSAGPPPMMVTTAEAQWFEVPGRGGAKGLRVAINPDGAVFLGPVDPAAGAGFALSGEAARDLVIILRTFLPRELAGEADR